jgi:hypothetical protein
MVITANMQVLVKNGIWKNGGVPHRISNKVFKLQKPWYVASDNQGTLAVHGTKENGLEDRVCRIKCEEHDFEYVQDGQSVTIDQVVAKEVSQVNNNMDYEKHLHEIETEDQAIARITHTFSMFEDIVTSVAEGHIRGLIVCGPPGIGKSHTVVEVLERKSIGHKIKHGDLNFKIVKGFASPINVYKTLYDYSAPRDVVVFDDADDALMDDTALNVLKAALDSGKHRTISWLAESSTLRQAEIPTQFDFKGSVIFLTNYDFERTSSARLRAHMDAMLSRCHYLDLSIGSQRDQLLRIKQIVMQGTMLHDYEFENGEEMEILEYIMTHGDYLRELSLRMVIKIADMRKTRPRDWKTFVEMTCFKRQARFAKMVNHIK